MLLLSCKCTRNEHLVILCLQMQLILMMLLLVLESVVLLLSIRIMAFPDSLVCTQVGRMIL